MQMQHTSICILVACGSDPMAAQSELLQILLLHCQQALCH
jgi:hypothetical protein